MLYFLITGLYSPKQVYSVYIYEYYMMNIRREILRAIITIMKQVSAHLEWAPSIYGGLHQRSKMVNMSDITS